MTKGCEKILVLRGGAIGDFILTLPALTALRERYPRAHLELAGYPRIARLVLETGVVDRFISLDSAGMASLFSADSQPCGRLIGFDLIVSYLRDPDGTVRANLKRTGCDRVIATDPLPVAGTHTADHLAAALKQAGISSGGPAIPRLSLSAIRKPVDNRLLLHPGSGGACKNWAVNGFVELACMATDQLNAEPMFIFGEADTDIREEIIGKHPHVRILPECDLYELALELNACRSYVGNDSGVTHLAGAAGTGVVALFGPTDPAMWGPRGTNVRVVRSDEATHASLLSMPTERVFAAVQRQWMSR